MPENETTNDQESQVSNDEASVESSTASTSTTQEPPADDKNTGTDDIPDWARKQIEKANKEAASYRVQLREVQDQFKDAKTEAELESILKPLSDKLDSAESRNRELERKLVIHQHGLDEELAEFITGDDPSAWAVQAKKLAERISTPAQNDRKGGLYGRSGTGAKTDDDPTETAKRIVARNRY